MVTRQNLTGSRIAVFSDCFRFRYELLIRWSEGPVLTMCCLNPSTADEISNDPTVLRQCERARRLCFGAFLMLNAFAFRSPDPLTMKRESDPYGEWRDPYCLIDAYRRHQGSLLIAAWGIHAKHRDRHGELLAGFSAAKLPVHCLQRTQDGYPSHPLYLPYELAPKAYA